MTQKYDTEKGVLGEDQIKNEFEAVKTREVQISVAPLLLLKFKFKLNRDNEASLGQKLKICI